MADPFKSCLGYGSLVHAVHGPGSFGERAMDKDTHVAPVDVRLPRLPNVEVDIAMLKGQIGTTTAAEMRPGPVTYQGSRVVSPCGIQMRSNR